jgi:hypothetical protein
LDFPGKIGVDELLRALFGEKLHQRFHGSQVGDAGPPVKVPEALVIRAKKRTGIDSDTDLIEVALANIAVADDYADWLLSRRGVLDREADLDF